MNKCDCYHIQTERRYTYHITSEPVYYDCEVGVCWGTKERDKCSCGGNEAKCDFYPEVRERTEKELKKNSTNADFIRSADDKKLAEILVDIGWDCSFCSEYEKLENEPLLRGEKCDDHCAEHCLEWLKKTAKK